MQAAMLESLQQSQDRRDVFSESATARSFSIAGNSRSVTAEPLTIQSTVGTIRLIQPIQIVTTSRPNQLSRQQQSSFPSRQTPVPRTSVRPRTSRPRPSPRPTTSSFSSFFSSSNPSQRPRAPKQQPPALTFVDNGLVAVLGLINLLHLCRG